MSFSAGIPGCGKTREMMEASVREHPKYIEAGRMCFL